MPDYHDIFWKLILLRIDCAIEFFRFLLKEKAEFLELENLISIQDIFYRKKKLLYDILYEIPYPKRYYRKPIFCLNPTLSICNAYLQTPFSMINIAEKGDI